MTGGSLMNPIDMYSGPIQIQIFPLIIFIIII